MYYYTRCPPSVSELVCLTRTKQVIDIRIARGYPGRSRGRNRPTPLAPRSKVRCFYKWALCSKFHSIGAILCEISTDTLLEHPILVHVFTTTHVTRVLQHCRAAEIAPRLSLPGPYSTQPHCSLNPAFCTQSPNHESSIQEPETRHPEPRTRNTEHRTRIPEPGARNPEPETRDPDPGTLIKKSEVCTRNLDPKRETRTQERWCGGGRWRVCGRSPLPETRIRNPKPGPEIWKPVPKTLVRKPEACTRNPDPKAGSLYPKLGSRKQGQWRSGGRWRACGRSPVTEARI